jgi:hypothetical protein
MGVVAVILWVVAIVIVESAEGPGDDPSALETLAYFEREESSIYAGSLIFFLGTLFFVWFAASVRQAILEREGGTGRLAAIAFAAAAMKAVFDMAFVAPHVAGAFAANESDAPLDAGAAQALWYVGDGFFVAAEFAAALFFVAAAVAAFRTRVLPLWLAWLSLIAAVALMIPPIGWAALIFGVPVWVLLVSFLLWRRASVAGAHAA